MEVAMVLAFLNQVMADSAKFMNMRTGFRKSRYLVRKSEMFVENEA